MNENPVDSCIGNIFSVCGGGNHISELSTAIENPVLTNSR
jgi:hypothetical protein